MSLQTKKLKINFIVIIVEIYLVPKHINEDMNYIGVKLLKNNYVIRNLN